MRLSVEAGLRLTVLGLTALVLSGCSLLGGGDRTASLGSAGTATHRDATGPAADYPIVLGEPYTIDGTLYTPADTMNSDMVGYASRDGGAGVTIAHRTLPLPSYVEITSLSTGKTILARVERRGPLEGSQFVALSADAAALLEVGDDAPVRVRRVNPVEKDRAELRAGRPAPDRMDTPKALVEVLRRKLPATGSASLRGPVPAKPAADTTLAVAGPAPAPQPAIAPQPVIGGVAMAEPAVAPSSPVKGDFVIQAGTFASQDNANRAAKALGGHVTPAGKLFRVRTGPFTSRGQADAALAKVRAAGYSDARVTTAG